LLPGNDLKSICRSVNREKTAGQLPVWPVKTSVVAVGTSSTLNGAGLTDARPERLRRIVLTGFELGSIGRAERLPKAIRKVGHLSRKAGGRKRRHVHQYNGLGDDSLAMGCASIVGSANSFGSSFASNELRQFSDSDIHPILGR
jgi:hypothetical protein